MAQRPPLQVHNYYLASADDHVKQYNSRGWIIVVSWIMAFAWPPLAIVANITAHDKQPMSLLFIAAAAGPLFFMVQVILNIFLLALPQKHRANLLLAWLGMLVWWTGCFLTVLPVTTEGTPDSKFDALESKHGLEAVGLLVDIFNVSYSGLAVAAGGVAVLIVGISMAIREADDSRRSLLSHTRFVAPYRSRLMR